MSDRIVIIYPARTIGGPLRVVANRMVARKIRGHYPGLCLSANKHPATFRRATAERLLPNIRRDVDRPIILPVSEWSK